MSDIQALFVATPWVQVQLAPHTAFGVLRLEREAPRAGLETALGLAFPEAPNTSAGVRPRALATAPGEWALIDAPADEVRNGLACCPDVLGHYADLSDARVGFHVTGDDASQLIRSECPLDLDQLEPDHCAQSLFAGMPILVDRRAGRAGFRLYVDVSLAAHLRAWLAALAEGSN